MLFACWITKATDTHSGYVILFAFPLQQWSHKCALMLHYTYTACLVSHTACCLAVSGCPVPWSINIDYNQFLHSGYLNLQSFHSDCCSFQHQGCVLSLYTVQPICYGCLQYVILAVFILGVWLEAHISLTISVHSYRLGTRWDQLKNA